MADLFDYLHWRGDILFSQVPPTPVDTLIFSALSYIRWNDVLKENALDPVSLRQAADHFFQLDNIQERVRSKNDLTLLKMAAATPRFGDVGLCFYRDIFIAAEDTQFSAMTVLLQDGTALLVYRGTDQTLTGWKEDLNMTFQEHVPAQGLALTYLKEYAASSDRPLRLCGHSKGGNLAVYAAAKCGPELQARILEVYNHDGPGFREPMMKDPGYLAIVPRVRTYVPQSSVVGMLLEHEEPYSIIKSTSIGLLQHEPYSWSVMGGDFLKMEERDTSSKFVDQTLRLWMDSMTPEERSNFVDTLFSMLQSSGAERVNELMKPRNLLNYLKILSTDEKTRDILSEQIGELIDSISAASEQLERDSDAKSSKDEEQTQ